MVVLLALVTAEVSAAVTAVGAAETAAVTEVGAAATAVIVAATGGVAV